MENDIEFLNDLGWGYRAARILHIANRLDIFTLLWQKQMSVEQIYQQCHSEPVMTEKLLIACTALGLLEKHADKYKNTELSQKYLVRDKQLYQGDIIAHSATVWNFWDKLTDAIYTGATIKAFEPDEHRDFILAMHNIAVVGRTQMFIDNVDLSGRKKLFDVGGGPGTYSIQACRRYPELRAVIFDLPETIAIAEEIIGKEKMQDRISLQEGNWDTDDFGEGNDVVLLSDVMHGPGSGAEMKLKKAYDSMVDGGLVVIQEFLLNDEKTGPLVSALFNVMVGAYSKTELISVIESAGFTNAELVVSSEELGSNWVTAKKQ